MPERLAFGFADLHPAAVRIKACCLSCPTARFFTADRPAAVGDINLRAIEKRRRYTDRSCDGRQPPCGGRMEVDIVKPCARHMVLRDGA